jgi:hypothetical protein
MPRSPADQVIRPQSKTRFTKVRAYNWSNPQRVAEKRTIGNCLDAIAAVADKTPAIISPAGKDLTPHGIKTRIPDNKLVPTQILNKISKIKIVIAAAIKGLVFLLKGVTLKSYPEKSNIKD